MLWEVGKELVSNLFLYLVLFGMTDSRRLDAGQRRSGGQGKFACDTVGLRG